MFSTSSTFMLEVGTLPTSITGRTGCILLSVGQDDFHDGVLDTLSFVVNQSDFTVQILRNVTDFLTFVKAINVEVYLPSDVQQQIDKLNVDLNSAADTLSEKTNESSGKIRRVIDNVRCALIVVAVVMLILAVLGFLLSILGHKHAIYIFIMSGWLLVAVTLALCAGFAILNNMLIENVFNGGATRRATPHARYVSRGSWEISSRDLHDSQIITMVPSDRGFVNSDYN